MPTLKYKLISTAKLGRCDANPYRLINIYSKKPSIKSTTLNKVKETPTTLILQPLKAILNESHVLQAINTTLSILPQPSLLPC